MPEFLLEVGFEEMPAPWLPELAVQLSTRFAELAEREALDPRVTQTYQTPRRLVLRADLLMRQPDRIDAVWGPAVKIARDALGKWTKAAEGFAKKNSVRLEDLRIATKGSRGIEGGRPAGALTQPSEDYVVGDVPKPGRAAIEVLPMVIAEALRALNFPKRMNWDAWLDDGKGAFPFGRPIRWLVAMLDGTVIPLVIYEAENGGKGKARVASGPATLGHRFLPKGAAGKPQTVRSFSELREALSRNFVVLDQEERAVRIAEGLAKVAGQGLIQDHGLRTEWRDLVEYPTVVSGDVPLEFRTLPNEVLRTVLVHHQKYIPLTTADGSVARFAAVTNTDASSSNDIVRGMERVVVARLRDAAFFYAEDLKRPLADRVADLSGVTFHRGLGTYADKAKRLVSLVEAMGKDLGLLSDTERMVAAEAALLAKADLTTLMVREFPELQGVIGGIYLRAQGAPDAIATAVSWHYQLGAGAGSAPDTGLPTQQMRVSAAVSLADRLDTLAGYFGLGLVPTGSSDPFGLRRAAQGVIRIVLDFWHPTPDERRPDLMALMRQAVSGYANLLSMQPSAVEAELNRFFKERFAFVLRTQGYAPDEIEAVLESPNTTPLKDPLDTLARVQALQRVRKQAPEDFAHLAMVFKRAKNILDEREAAKVDARLFEAEAERALAKALEQVDFTVRTEHHNGRSSDLSLRFPDGTAYEIELKALASLRAPVDRFFTDVLVMAEDPKVRGNRLALLNQTLSLFYRIADISKLGGQS